MLQEKPRIFNQFIGLKWQDNKTTSEEVLKNFWSDIKQRGCTDSIYLYEVFPARTDVDILLWVVKKVESESTISDTFSCLRKVLNNWRNHFKFTLTFWGITKPSIYSRGKSPQELDPLINQRATYLVLYPFVKTPEWYLLSSDTRKGMMNEHIRVGRQYPEIKQLLLYSFGVQDQEFVVVYEMEDLLQFVDLVQDLRNTQVRLYTKVDTPVITATFKWGI